MNENKNGVKRRKPNPVNEWFRKFAQKTAESVGSKWSFAISLGIILIWAALGPQFHYSDTWQLVINTATTIVTFLMVFLIQNTQNRDAKAIQLKLDELLRSHSGARNHLINLESLSEEELSDLQKEFERLCRKAPKNSLDRKIREAQTEKVVEAKAARAA